MKLSLVLVAAAVGFSTAADAATRGYLYTGRHDAIYFSGLNDEGEQGSGFLISFALQMGSITEKQYQIMANCMDKKTTHAIQVVETVTPISVPSGLPGRSTTFHNSSYEVACVPAPGFLQVWRKKMDAR